MMTTTTDNSTVQSIDDVYQQAFAELQAYDRKRGMEFMSPNQGGPLLDESFWRDFHTRPTNVTRSLQEKYDWAARV